MDIEQLLSDARLPELTTDLCLRGDLVADYDLAVRQATASVVRDSLGAGRAEDDERVAGLREQIRQATITVRMRAVSRRRWDELMRSHPPRPDNDPDQRAGYNIEDFYFAAVRESIVDPSMTPSQFERLVDKLTESQYNGLIAVVNRLNVHGVSLPL